MNELQYVDFANGQSLRLMTSMLPLCSLSITNQYSAHQEINLWFWKTCDVRKFNSSLRFFLHIFFLLSYIRSFRHFNFSKYFMLCFSELWHVNSIHYFDSGQWYTVLWKLIAMQGFLVKIHCNYLMRQYTAIVKQLKSLLGAKGAT